MDIRQYLTSVSKCRDDTVELEERNENEEKLKSKSADETSEQPLQTQVCILYMDLCALFDRIEATTKRLEIQSMLRDFFVSVLSQCPGDLEACVYLACNQVAPDYKGIELGIGDGLLIKAISQITGKSTESVKISYKKEGDLGSVAATCKGTQTTLSFAVKKSSLTVQHVLQTFRGLADMTGSKSQDRKVMQIKGLLVAASPLESKFIVRGLQGKLRIGLAKQTVLISLAQAAVLRSLGTEIEEEDRDSLHPLARALLESKSMEDKYAAGTSVVKQAFSECPSITELVGGLLSGPLYQLLNRCQLIPGIPVSPMLAKPEKSIAKVMARISGLKVCLEYKYDGERCQVHLLDTGELKFFSRNLEDVTSKYPDLLPVMKAAAKIDINSYVIDTEVVAVDRVTGQLLPFQVLSTRKRKDEMTENVKVQIVLQAFDLLYVNGKSLLSNSLKERRDILRESFLETEAHFGFAKFMDYQENGDSAPIEEFMLEAVKGNCEGLMVKTLEGNATYEPSKRSLNWLKLKKDYLSDGSSIADSLDLVPIGAYYGRGKRVGAFGAYLLACYEPETEEYQSVCKIGTGFSNEQLQTLSDMLKDHIIPRKPNYFVVGDSIEPDVWIDPCKVWEVRAADLSKSPVHKAAIGKIDPVRGISIRFPRLVRERDDKSPENATTANEIVDMYNSQDSVKNNGAFHAAIAAEDEEDWEI